MIKDEKALARINQAKEKIAAKHGYADGVFPTRWDFAIAGQNAKRQAKLYEEVLEEVIQF